MTHSHTQQWTLDSPISASDAVAQYQAQYLFLTSHGPYKPMVLTWHAVGMLLLLCSFLVDYRRLPAARVVRFAVWLFFAAGFVYNLLYIRASNPAVAYGVGLISVWLMIWSAHLLVFADIQRDARRIKRRHFTNRTSRVSSNDKTQSAGTSTSAASAVVWQSYPDRLSWERLDWVADILFNFRGTGWNWRIDNLPALSKTLQRELDITATSRHAKPAKYRRDGEAKSLRDRSHLLRHTILVAIRNYVIIDLLKTISVCDPYFWGTLDGPPPSYLPSILQQSPVIVKTSHLLLSLAAMGIALQNVFSIAPLFFVGLLGSRIGVRGEPWMYPDTFGSFRAVLDQGLLGWWSFWWHSIFRQGFVAPARQLNSWLKLERNSTAARMMQLVVAFVLSGCIHAGGSLTQLGQSRPIKGPFRFFALQIFGIAVQLAVTSVLRRASFAKSPPYGIRQLTNFLYVHIWFYHTAPYLVDDLAVGGLWLFEPQPIGLCRGLGFGPDDGTGFIRWTSRPLWWHQGRHWWDTGIAM